MIDGVTILNHPPSWSEYRAAVERCDVSRLVRFIEHEQRLLSRLMEGEMINTKLNGHHISKDQR